MWEGVRFKRFEEVESVGADTVQVEGKVAKWTLVNVFLGCGGYCDCTRVDVEGQRELSSHLNYDYSYLHICTCEHNIQDSFGPSDVLLGERR